MRPERLYLSVILSAADAISIFLQDRSRQYFMMDYQLRSAVTYQMIIIGEALSHISAEVRARHPEIAWTEAIGLRNYAAHGYFSIDWAIIWDTATVDVPVIQHQIAAVIATEYPEGVE